MSEAPAITADTQSHLDNVQRRYGAPIFWQRGSVIHRCGGAMVHPGTFLLWPICGKGDVPAGQGFKSIDARVDCPDCLIALGRQAARPESPSVSQEEQS